MSWVEGELSTCVPEQSGGCPASVRSQSLFSWPWRFWVPCHISVPQPVLTDTVLPPSSAPIHSSSHSHMLLPLPFYQQRTFQHQLSTSSELSSITYYLHVVKHTLQSSQKLSATLITTDSSFLLDTLLASVTPHFLGFPLTSSPIPSPLHTFRIAVLPQSSILYLLALSFFFGCAMPHVELP